MGYQFNTINRKSVNHRQNSVHHCKLVHHLKSSNYTGLLLFSRVTQSKNKSRLVYWFIFSNWSNSTPHFVKISNFFSNIHFSNPQKMAFGLPDEQNQYTTPLFACNFFEKVSNIFPVHHFFPKQWKKLPFRPKNYWKSGVLIWKMWCTGPKNDHFFEKKMVKR